ncbi:MAG: hypothetical protein KBG72_09250, partial [Agrobacterium sp.]|nr:hypothetical protein [Agrobacterium sp.]
AKLFNFRVGNGRTSKRKAPAQTFFPEKSSFFEVFFAAFSGRPKLKHPSQNGKSVPCPASPEDFTRL